MSLFRFEPRGHTHIHTRLSLAEHSVVFPLHQLHCRLPTLSLGGEGRSHWAATWMKSLFPERRVAPQRWNRVEHSGLFIALVIRAQSADLCRHVIRYVGVRGRWGDASQPAGREIRYPPPLSQHQACGECEGKHPQRSFLVWAGRRAFVNDLRVLDWGGLLCIFYFFSNDRAAVRA